MQVIADIFAAFGGTAKFAAAIGEKRDTVYRWLRRGRIPESAWASVISAAKNRSIPIEAADIFRVNLQPKPNGKAGRATIKRRRAYSEAGL